MKWKWWNTSNCFYIISMIGILTTGCKKFVHVDEPDDSLNTSAVFSNDSLAQTAVTGLYIKIMGSSKFILNGGMSLFPGLSADELVRNSIGSSIEDQFTSNSIMPGNTFINVNLWKAAYTYIYQCNICIEGLKKSTGVNEVLKQRLQGEVLFFRALCYYYLVNLYGDVPLVLGTNADVNLMLPRTPVHQVYEQMVTDLTAASDMLTNDKLKTTLTQYATEALLARVYLFMGNWNKAAEMASIVIGSGQFSLVDDLTLVFKSESPETIFELAPVNARMNSAEGFIFVPPSPSSRPNYILTDSLWKAFETGDLRKEKWVNSVTMGGKNLNYPYKYRIYINSAVTERNIVLRLAEQYLIRAEAYAQLNKIDSAVIDLNKIRKRAGLPGFSTTIGFEECMQSIAQERRIELFAEWGHRWFDLKRTNRANTVLSAKSGWSNDDQLYPIPLSELEYAPNLKQNHGYD